MSKHQTMAPSSHALLGLICCPNCKGGPRVDGKPTREGLEQARRLLNHAQQILDDYEKELRALEYQQIIASMEAERQGFLAKAAASANNRSKYLETAEKYTKAMEILAPLAAPREAAA